jgi:hypothetical protein
MTYSRLSSHDASGDIEDSEGNEFDPRTPLDRTIDQIGMGTHAFEPFFLCVCPVDVAATHPPQATTNGPSSSSAVSVCKKDRPPPPFSTELFYLFSFCVFLSSKAGWPIT